MAAQKIGEYLGCEMFFDYSYNCPALKLWGYSTDLSLRRAIAKKLKSHRNSAK